LRVSQTSRRAYLTIGAALQAARNLRKPVRIEIEPGRYQESLSFGGDVELVPVDGPATVTIASAQGPVVDGWGQVRLSELVLVGSGDQAVRCSAGTLVVERSQIQGLGGVSMWAAAGTSVTLRECLVGSGRVVFSGAEGVAERCDFTNSSTNAVAVIEGAVVRLQGCRIDHPRFHAVRVTAAQATVVGCAVTGTGSDSIYADKQARLDVKDCRITASQSGGVSYIEQSTGSVEGTMVSESEHGIATQTGGRPVVRDCVFRDCRDTGIIVNSKGLGQFENCEVVRAGNVAVFATTGGSAVLAGCRVVGGHVGIALIDGRGRFDRCDITGVAAVALRVWQGSTAEFSHIRVVGSLVGLDTSGAGGTKATLLDSDFREIGRIGVSVLEQGRVTLRNSSFRGGLGGLSAGGEAQLLAYDCRVEQTNGGGVIAAGKSVLTAERLTVAQPGLYGLAGQDSAWLDVKDSEFGDTRFIGVTTSGSCGGHLVRCSVTGTRGSSVVHNGRVVLTDLRSELPVTEHAPESPPESAQQIVNYFTGPVFNAAVYNPLLVQDDFVVPERTPMPDTTPSEGSSVTNNYHGPVIHGEVSNAQLAWNNNTVHQNLGHVEQVAPGFEEVARVVTAVLERLADLGLPASDVRDATENANEVLAEVARPEPDRGVVRRGLTALKGVLAQLAAGLLTGVNAGAVEVGKDLVRDIGHLTF
jgi:hypothetical protein